MRKRAALVRWAIAAGLTIGASWSSAVFADSPMPVGAGDPVRGEVLYQACQACHSLDEDDVGPPHRGVLGRRAGSIQGYAYSPALKNSGLVWDAATLDRWLTNPQALVPGAKMFFAMPKPQDRADVIAYLARLR